LVLPFAFQWTLGGFSSSGSVMIWAMVSLLGALAFSGAREATIWLLLYCALTIFSGVIDPWLVANLSFPSSEGVRTGFLALNLVLVTGIVFGLAIYQNVIRTEALNSLEVANKQNGELNSQLATEVVIRDQQLAELRALQGKLHERTEALTTSLEQLNLAQSELIEREKLAALGRLVAGVAHEVNTPLGVVYMSVTLGLERLEELRTTLTREALSRRQVFAGIDGGLETLRIAATNAERAAKLISDFKRIAVDQTSEGDARIELKAYLDALVQSISPMLTRAGVKVRCEGDEVPLDTKPGAIAHVVTNLLQNAVLHAFPEQGGPEERRIDVRCTSGESHVLVEVSDNGVGMEEEVVRHIYEPFFTTKRGNGGSGLGMHIVHQQVHGALFGTIAIDSKPGEGTRVRLRLPLTLPAVDQNSPARLTSAP
jgi:signal transduction histidine kinase